MTAPNFSLTFADDPLGLAGDYIQLESVDSNLITERHEVIGDSAKYITNAVQSKRPRTEGSCSYRLLDTATLTLPLGTALGQALDVNYVLTGISGSYSQEDNPIITVNWVKYSSIDKFKPYVTAALTAAFTGGYGVTELFGATLPADTAPVSSDFSIEFLSADAGLGTDADYIDGGMYFYGFKRTVDVTAYGVVTIPAAGYETSRDDGASKTPEGWATYKAGWFDYLDAVTLA